MYVLDSLALPKTKEPLWSSGIYVYLVGPSLFPGDQVIENNELLHGSVMESEEIGE